MIKVFIADDSDLVRERLIAMLSDLPEIEIIGQAQNVLQATNSIRRSKPDVVILDIRMPGGSGIDVLRSIKKDRPAPIVMMLTNYPYPQYRKRCMDVGADCFFDKSTEFNMVTDALKQIIQDSRGAKKGKN